jgi:hypothetical protein
MGCAQNVPVKVKFFQQFANNAKDLAENDREYKTLQ